MSTRGSSGAAFERNTIGHAISDLRRRFSEASIDDSAVEARMMVRHAAGLSPIDLITNSSMLLTSEQLNAIEACAIRRLSGEPLQYITGHAGFYGRDFAVDRRVLIPRPETELLVEQVMARVNEHGEQAPRVLDIGTGSGVLAITLAAELGLSEVVATDISRDALIVARENADRHRVDERIKFVQCSLAEAIEGRFDFVISNPPYVRSGFLDGDEVQRELSHEPSEALDGGPDGMDVYNELIPLLAGLLAPGGAAYLEIDPPVADACVALAHRVFVEASAQVSVMTDLAGLERCLVIELPQ